MTFALCSYSQFWLHEARNVKGLLPNHYTSAVFCGPRIETCHGIAENVIQKPHAPRRYKSYPVDLCCANVAKKAIWKCPGNHRAGPSVMSMENFVRAVQAGGVS